MDDALARTLTHLRKGDLRRLAVRRGDGIALFEGEVWLTQDGARDDVVVSAGDTFVFDRDGNAWLQALQDAAWVDIGDEPTGLAAATQRGADAAAPIDAYTLAHAARRARDAAVGHALARLLAAVRAIVNRPGPRPKPTSPQ